eukprot:COSAG01_NODE_2839_length_6992_cov_15.825040_6_plen_84_part_00
MIAAAAQRANEISLSHSLSQIQRTCHAMAEEVESMEVEASQASNARATAPHTTHHHCLPPTYRAQPHHMSRWAAVREPVAPAT